MSDNELRGDAKTEIKIKTISAMICLICVIRGLFYSCISSKKTLSICAENLVNTILQNQLFR